jgi:hypothetical protein
MPQAKIADTETIRRLASYAGPSQSALASLDPSAEHVGLVVALASDTPEDAGRRAQGEAQPVAAPR